MTYQQIDHVGIAVSDMDAAIARYQQLLGVAPSVRKVMERDGIEAAMLDLGSTHVELVAPTREDSAISRFLEKRGEGMHHVAYRVDDIRAALADARDHGAQLLDPEPRVGVMGHLVAFIHPKATLGVLTELVQAEHPA
ncbi:MAG: methylmalonyl-CoA/ethylmalonyl-CoA epimerase [Chloroflexota bacterium]|nr:methylmalonyl-CoA/ethylmalonyl-CoA epimerase [Chloroflexota bacterium]